VLKTPGCLLITALAAAQTAETPVRAVTDSGVVTTRQAITPAGTQAVFQGRVYGLAFGTSSGEFETNWPLLLILSDSDCAPVEPTLEDVVCHYRKLF
jgi:hypothetical protein